MNAAREALTRAVDKAIANGSPIFVNHAAQASDTFSDKVRQALVTLNNHYGYGDVRSIVVYNDGRIDFQVQGFGMAVKMRKGHWNGNTVKALGHQRKIV
jgi:hypothetical protein